MPFIPLIAALLGSVLLPLAAEVTLPASGYVAADYATAATTEAMGNILPWVAVAVAVSVLFFSVRAGIRFLKTR